MTDQELDALMKRILLDSMKLDLEADTEEATVSFNPSSRYQRQMRAMLKDPLGWARKKTRPMWKMILQKVAIVLLVISVGFGTIMAVSPTARAAFVRVVKEWYETYIVYRHSGDSISTWIPHYEITDLPNGYTEFQRIERQNYTQIIYQNAEGTKRIYLQYIYMHQGSAIYFATEGVSVSSVTVNGLAGEIYLSDDLESMDNTITWIDYDSNIQFAIDASLDEKDILYIAESVSLAKTTN